MKELDGGGSSLLAGGWPVFFALFAATVLAAGGSLDGAGGLTHGAAALLLAAGASVYWLRKRVYRYRLGPTRGWLKAHVYLALMSLFPAMLHSGGIPVSMSLSGVLLALYLAVFLSGVLGLVVYTVVPVSLSKRNRDAVPKDEMPARLDKLLEDSDRTAARASGPFRELYDREIRPLFVARRARFSYLLGEEQAFVPRWEAGFDRMKPRVPAGEVFDFNLLKSQYVEKERLVFQLSKLRAMEAWLFIHVPLTAAFLAAAAFHVASIAYY